MIIPARFNGPPDSANGGYTAGVLAGYDDVECACLGRADRSTEAVVTLHRPPPLDTPLSLVREDGELRVRDGANRLVATASPVPGHEPVTETVPAVSYATARQVMTSYPGFAAHPFPTCYVCGPLRTDGLRLFPGRLADGRTAAAWRVPDEVSPVLVWAALDCPGGWSVPLEGRPYVLGRLAARVDAVPAPGDECVVMGRTVAVSGRKAQVLSTLYGPTGDVLARARAVWISPSTG